MCGIAGFYRFNQEASTPDLRERLPAMAEAMRHRGPDDGGVHFTDNGRVGLASRRLAIRDLSPAGHMPMGNDAASVWITYNGEIYNAKELRAELEGRGYAFRSHSDTEVILHGYEAWGADVVQRIRGMFAFAILDTRDSPDAPVLLLARDRLGIKPVYYAHTGGLFLFASELRGITASGCVSEEQSPAAVVAYLTLGAIPNPLTIYREIRALEPGCTLTLSLRDTAVPPAPVRYWSLPTDVVRPASYADAVDEIRGLLEEAVRIRLVSDVPLGAFLSGGIDSSAVVALMRKATSGAIRTCSMVFEEAEYSEAPFAQAVAQATGAEHFERVITASDVASHLDRILWAMDQPTMDGVNSYFVSLTAREAGLTVALSGLGGDELFGGYPGTFQGAPQLLRSLRLMQAVPGGASLGRVAASLLPSRDYLAKARDAMGRPASLASAYLARRGVFAPSEVRALVQPDVWEQAAKEYEPVAHIERGAGAHPDTDGVYSWLSRAELTSYTHNQLLRDTDVMSMAHSLEVRVPLLDHKLVEAALRIPAEMKSMGPAAKPLFLAAMGDQLPALVRDRRGKQGFTFPFAVWMRGPLRKWMESTLIENAAPSLIRPEAAASVWRAFDEGRVHWSRAWTLAALNGWTAADRSREAGL